MVVSLQSLVFQLEEKIRTHTTLTLFNKSLYPTYAIDPLKKQVSNILTELDDEILKLKEAIYNYEKK